MNTLRSPVAVVAGDSARITSPLSRHKIPPCSLLPTVILRRFQDKRENLIKLGRKMRSLSGSRRGKEEGKGRAQRSRQERQQEGVCGEVSGETPSRTVLRK